MSTLPGFGANNFDSNVLFALLLSSLGGGARASTRSNVLEGAVVVLPAIDGGGAVLPPSVAASIA